MNLIRNINHFINHVVAKLQTRNFACIELIDVKNKKFVLSIRGCPTPVQIKFEEIIYDWEIISALEPIQAAWAGYYFGINYLNFNMRIQPDMSTKSSRKSDFKYRLVSQTRNKYINYIETSTSAMKISLPLEILKENDIISNFSSGDALSIGMLQGIYESRHNEIFSNKIAL